MTTAQTPTNDTTTPRNLPGVEFLHQVISGALPAPSIWAVMNFTMTHAEVGRVALRGAPTTDHGNLLGMTHGGWYATILDSALGGAVNSAAPAGARGVTLELKMNIIRPIAPGTLVEAVGMTDHVGRRSGVAHAELRSVKDGKLCATASTTLMILDDTPS